MESYKSEKRTQKIISVVSSRQKSLRVVLENIHDPHNVSAIFRTCDAVGVQKVSLLYYIEKFPKIGRKSSASAFKWVEKDKYKDVKTCYDDLKAEGFSIYASTLDENAVSFYELDLTKKVAIVLGNEHRGISEDAANLADKKFFIPMLGMVQSLNVSVAAAVILYEALRQRRDKGMYNKSEYSKEELEELINLWCKK
ncbi:MAG: RNA methyltransferase [Bacteroidetes bacterium]|nr:RNA methyltransferase [Bacteroidota bacterium]